MDKFQLNLDHYMKLEDALYNYTNDNFLFIHNFINSYYSNNFSISNTYHLALCILKLNKDEGYNYNRERFFYEFMKLKDKELRSLIVLIKLEE
jgi:hypothetical protein